AVIERRYSKSGHCPPSGSALIWWRRCCGTAVRRGSGAPTLSRLRHCPPSGGLDSRVCIGLYFFEHSTDSCGHNPGPPIMNAPNSDFRRVSTVFIAALFLVSGCSRKDESQPGPTASKAPPVRPAMASAEKTSFQEVTSQLDPGGNLFAFFGTEQWISGASDYVSSWRGILEMVPILTDEQRAEANKGFDLAT